MGRKWKIDEMVWKPLYEHMFFPSLFIFLSNTSTLSPGNSSVMTSPSHMFLMIATVQVPLPSSLYIWQSYFKQTEPHLAWAKLWGPTDTDNFVMASQAALETFLLEYDWLLMFEFDSTKSYKNQNLRKKSKNLTFIQQKSRNWQNYFQIFEHDFLVRHLVQTGLVFNLSVKLWTINIT